MFTDEKISKIFSNIEQIYEFHQGILKQLEECFVEEDPCASEIGSVFLNNVSFLCGFCVRALLYAASHNLSGFLQGVEIIVFFARGRCESGGDSK